MPKDYEPLESDRQRPHFWRTLIIPAVAFVAGVILMGWVLTNWTGAADLVGVEAEREAEEPAPERIAELAAVDEEEQEAPGEEEPATELRQTADEAEDIPSGTVVIDPEIARRVARVERRIGEIEREAESAVGNADRAEGLLVAFAARRALDRGVPLGYIEALLRQRFGASHRAAVATIITAARDPVTLEELEDGLADIAPQLVGGGDERSWWSALKAEFSNLVTVRKEGTPSTIPAERLKRATRAIEAGQVDVALAEVLRMPGREAADEWIAKARRYVAARRALDEIETAALLNPRQNPRPGEPVERRDSGD